MSSYVDGSYYISSIVRGRYSSRQTQQIGRQTADMDGYGTVIVMDQEPGAAGVNNIDTYQTRILREFAIYPK